MTSLALLEEGNGGNFPFCVFCMQGIHNRQRVKKEVTDMIADLQLVDKTKIQSQRLSGGMKRKLR